MQLTNHKKGINDYLKSKKVIIFQMHGNWRIFIDGSRYLRDMQDNILESCHFPT